MRVRRSSATRGEVERLRKRSRPSVTLGSHASAARRSCLTAWHFIPARHGIEREHAQNSTNHTGAKKNLSPVVVIAELAQHLATILKGGDCPRRTVLPARDFSHLGVNGPDVITVNLFPMSSPEMALISETTVSVNAFNGFLLFFLFVRLLLLSSRKRDKKNMIFCLTK